MRKAITYSLPVKGRVLEGPRGQRCRLLDPLGGGQFSEVWRAELLGDTRQEVAVKILTGDLGEEERRIFLREVEVLANLARHEQALDLQVGGESLFPQVFFTAADHTPPFFAEALATGKPLDIFLRQYGNLVERDGLVIGEQLCRAFRVLHEGLDRSYLDFQPRNVFWDTEQRRILVVDWNLLSAPGEADITGDLETIALLLYRLMVGTSAVAGRLYEPDGWQNLTSGTQRFFAQGLHTNLARRFPTAEQMRVALRQLVDWWEEESDALIQNAAQRLEPAIGGQIPKEKQESIYQAVLDMLDIARKRGAKYALISPIRERALRGVQETGILAKGRAAFQSADMQGAETAFAEALERAITFQERLRATRWTAVTLADVRDRESFIHWMQAFSAWTDALTEGNLEGMDPTPPSDLSTFPVPEPLSTEMAAWNALRKAQLADLEEASACQEAAANYRKAFQLAQTIPYGDMLLWAWGDLEDLAADLESKAAKLAQDRRRWEALEDNFREAPILGIEALERQLRSSPDRLVVQLALVWVERLWKEGRYDLAQRILDKVLAAATEVQLGEIGVWHRKIETSSTWDNRLKEISSLLSSGGHDSAVALQSTDWDQFAYVLKTIATMANADLDPLRDQAWSLAQQILFFPKLPPSRETIFLDISRQLAPDVETAEALQERLQQHKEARAQEQREAKLREQIASYRENARQSADTRLGPGYKEALTQLRLAIELNLELGDQNLADELNAEAERYRVAAENLQRERLEKQIQSCQQEAKALLQSTKPAQMEKAIKRLEEAVVLARESGDDHLARTLQAQMEAYRSRRDVVVEGWRRRELLPKGRDVADALKFIHRLDQEHAGAPKFIQRLDQEKIEDWALLKNAKRFANWLRERVFQQWESDFWKAYRRWDEARLALGRAVDWHEKERLIKEIDEAQLEIRQILSYLDENSYQYLRGFLNQCVRDDRGETEEA